MSETSLKTTNFPKFSIRKIHKLSNKNSQILTGLKMIDI